MKEESRENKREEWKGFLWAGCVSAAFFCLTYFFVAPLFAINDDLMIESIISGSYLKPYPYSYYFSAQLGWLLSGLYRMLPHLPWFGLFYVGCYVAGTASLLRIAFKKLDGAWHRAAAFLGILLVVTALCFQEFVLLHYTVLAAFLGAVGLVLFSLSREGRETFRPVIYFLLCYLVRENVFFMLAPFIAIAFLYLLLKNGIGRFREYLPEAAIFIVLFLALFTLNRGVLRGEEWKNYLEYNDVRTQVFDYLGLHVEEEAMEQYAKEGVTKEEVEIIGSYDLALFNDGTGNLKAMKVVEAYGEKARESVQERLVWAVKSYIHRCFMQKDDMPFNALALFTYLGLFVMILWKKRYVLLIPLGGLAAYRSAFWIYLLFKGRYPERVITSLYLMELAVLIAMAVREISGWEKKGRLWIVGLAVAACTFLAISVSNVAETQKVYRNQVKINQNDDLLIAYVKARPENFYFMDVYALVGRTKKVFESAGSEKENYLWMGGWMTRHPLYLEKLRTVFNGTDNAKDALLGGENAYLTIKEGAGAPKEQFEKWLGTPLTLVDVIEGKDSRYFIYQTSK